MSESKGQGRKVILLPSEGRLAIYLPQPWPLFCSAATQKRESTYLNYYGSAYNRGRQLLHCKTKLNQIQQNTRKFLTILTKRYTTPQPFYGPFFQNHPGEPVSEEDFWTLSCKGRLTDADTHTIRLGATPSRLTSAHLHHPPFFTGRMPFLLPSQQCQITEGN